MEQSGQGLALMGQMACAVAYGLLAARNLRTGIKGLERNAWFFIAAVLLSALWALSAALPAATDGASPEWLPNVLDLCRYAAWYGFMLTLLAARDEPWRTVASAWLAPVAALVLAFGLLPAGLSIWPGPDGVVRIGLLASLAQPVFGLVLLEQLFRNVARDGRWGIKPLMLGLGGLFVFDLYIWSQAVLFGQFDEDAFNIRYGIHALAVPLLMVAMRRQADWRARLQVSHNAAFYSATLLLAGAYLLAISAIGYYVRFFGGDWGRALQLAVLFSAGIFLLLLMLSGALRARLRVLVSKHFFAYRYDYREEWLKFTAMLSSPVSPQELGGLVVRGLADMVGSPGGSLWTRSTSQGRFEENFHTHALTPPATESPDSPFATFLAEQNWIIDVAEARTAPDRYAGMALPDWLRESTEVWAVIPLIVGDSLTGFVLLSEPHSGVELDWETRDLLKTASRQAAAFLAQLHATEALLEARKFEAFNRMSAFVVHDLKNIVTQLSLMLKNAKRFQDNPEFQQDMLITVESSLDRMRQMMLQLREGARPPGGALGVELLPVVERLKAVAASRGRELETPRIERVATRGHEERLERVLGHLVQNAFDATPETGRVWLDLARVSGHARIVVGDTGSGMTREFVESRLFKPFASTKESGMGIGSYESAQYIRELGGQLKVDSEPGRGTIIAIDLPLFESQHESDLKMTSAA
jgi:putative PEP-CTERM system histidine kinase